MCITAQQKGFREVEQPPIIIATNKQRINKKSTDELFKRFDFLFIITV